MNKILIFENPNESTITFAIEKLIDDGYTPYLPIYVEDNRAGSAMSFHETIDMLKNNHMVIFEKENDYSWYVYYRKNKLALNYRTTC